MAPSPVDVRILSHQAEPFRLVSRGEPITLTLTWGRGLGKSFFLRLMIWLLVAKWYGKKRRTVDGEMTGIRIYILMPTLKQFKGVHGALFEQENDTKWKFLGGKLNKTDYSITFPDGSFILPVPAAVATSERGRGFRGDVVCIDECDDIDSSVRDAVVRPWFTEPWSLGIEIDVGTPKRGRHGLLFRLFDRGQKREPGHYSFRVKSSDCPEIVSPKFLADEKRTCPAAYYAREYEADFDSAEGLVYPFDEAFHVREPPPNIHFNRYVVGGDHGWNDPGVLLLGGIYGHGDDAGLWILEEHYASERPNNQWDAIVTEHYQGIRGWLDPSRPDRINDYRRAGLNAHGADNSIEAGVSRVADLLVKRYIEGLDEPYARLYVHPRCVNTIREFKSYRRKRDPSNVSGFLEDIEDKNNHAMDSLRYMAIGEFGRPANHRHEVRGS